MVGIISAILAVTVIISLLLFLTFSKSYIPYDDKQFEIAELNGNIYVNVFVMLLSKDSQLKN